MSRCLVSFSLEVNRDPIVVHVGKQAFVPGGDETNEVLLSFFASESLGREGGREGERVSA